MTLKAQTYALSTTQLYEVTAAERLLADPGPKWVYTLRPVDLEYASGDVKPKSTSSGTVEGYNVWELANTTDATRSPGATGFINQPTEVKRGKTWG